MEKKLIWHDSEVSSWWKSRSQNDGLCFALAQDNVTDHILVMVKDLANLEYKVIASIPHSTLKDTKAAMDEAKKNNSPLPITKIIDEYYAEVQKMGGQRWDTSSLIKRFKK